jgi:biopolymer transport protein ExbD
MKLELRHKPLSSLSPISIADVVLLLIIFFLLTSTYVLEPGIKVKLPGAHTSDVVSKKDIRVSITRDGRLFLNDRLVGLDEFSTRLANLLKKSETRVIILRADKDVKVDMLVRIMDIAKSVGGEKFLIATKRMP